MKKLQKGRKLSRTSDQRRALLNSLASSLFINKRITSTLIKAKELRPFSEKLITKAKQKDLNNIRYVLKFVSNKASTELFDQISQKAKKRNGGYVRIIKMSPRKSDKSPMAIVELVDFEQNLDDYKKDKQNKGRLKKSGNDKSQKKVKKSGELEKSKKEKIKKPLKNSTTKTLESKTLKNKK
ncbi:MAG: 50S ribosomal protein L17 [Candidatus Moranbacteria bacterium]|nr:50S ribosomal protein L17 [Candidatus Moranbacteria bacterium]